MKDETRAVVATAEGRDREGFEAPGRGDAAWVTFFSRDRTPTAAMCAGLMELAPNGGRLAAHRHAQAELYFVHEGRGLLTVEGVQTALAAGVSAFIPGDAEHSLVNDGATTLKIFYVFATDSFADVVYRFSP